MLSEIIKKKLEEYEEPDICQYEMDEVLYMNDEDVSDDSDDEMTECCPDSDSDDEEIVSDNEQSSEEEPKKRKRINTTRALSNESFYNGGIETEVINTQTISISPLIESQYDYAVTEDPVLLQERKRNNEILYEIFDASPFRHSYEDPNTMMIKIPKEDIAKVFHYSKLHLLKRCSDISARELLMLINEFYGFDYNYVVRHIIGSRLYSEVLEEYYNDGQRSRIDESSAEPLF